MRLFDSSNKLIRAYLHLSYAFSFAFITLLVNQSVQIALGRMQTFDVGLATLVSLAISTAYIAVALYLHLPKMINRCFTIGRHFGL
jgi:hypothetical protein